MEKCAIIAKENDKFLAVLAPVGMLDSDGVINSHRDSDNLFCYSGNGKLLTFSPSDVFMDELNSTEMFF